MKKSIKYIIFIALITLAVQSIISSYFINNIDIGPNAGLTEGIYPEYKDKVMGYSGCIRNNTIFPIRVKKFTPLGGNGMIYCTTLFTNWGLSDINPEKLSKYENLYNKIIPPLSNYNLGIFYEFTGEYTVDPSAFEVEYSVFGIKFKEIIVNKLRNN